MSDGHASNGQGPARSCGACTACCRIPAIVEQDVRKAANVTCMHCVPGQGCAIYETRFEVCRGFVCDWLTDGAVGAHWQPDLCHMVLSPDHDTASLVVLVDEAHPNAWRAAPFINDLRAWAAAPTARRARVTVKVGDEVTVIFPNGEKPVGRMRTDQLLVINKIETMFWTAYDAQVVDSSDPRAGSAAGSPKVAGPDAIDLGQPAGPAL